MIFAEWVVPTINTSTQLSGAQTVGFWVGLGGWGTSQVLQAGTAATVSGGSVQAIGRGRNGSPPVIRWPIFAIKPGDTVSVLVCAPQSDHGYVSMMNSRTSQAISVGVSDPNGTAAYDGSSVEWVIEAIDTEMPNFGNGPVHPTQRGHPASRHRSDPRLHRQHHERCVYAGDRGADLAAKTKWKWSTTRSTSPSRRR